MAMTPLDRALLETARTLEVITGVSREPDSNTTLAGSASRIEYVRENVTQLLNPVGVTLEYFGGVGDGVTDNTAAFNAFREYHQDITNADPDVWVQLRLAHGKVYGSYDPLWGAGLDRLIVEGSGAAYQNIRPIGNSPHFLDNVALFPYNAAYVDSVVASSMTGKGVSLNYDQYHYIGSVSAGATSVTCTTAAQAANYAAGGWVILSDGIAYLGGQPPVPARFEYAEVASVDAGTGVVTFTRPLQHAYDAALPAFNTSYRTAEWPSRAKIFKVGATWNCRQVYRDLTVLPSVANPEYGAYFSGRVVVLDNCALPGHTFSNVMLGLMAGGRSESEHAFEPVDKLCTHVTHRDLELSGTTISGWGKDTHAAYNNVAYRATSVSLHRKGSWDNCTFAATVFMDRCEDISITNSKALGDVYDRAAQRFQVDGTTITYASGVITVPLTVTAAAMNTADVWDRLSKGLVLHVCNASGDTTGVVAVVTSITISGSNLLIGVNPSAALTAPFYLQAGWLGYHGHGNTSTNQPALRSASRGTLTNGGLEDILGNNINLLIAPRQGETFSRSDFTSRGRVQRVVVDVLRAYTGTDHANLFLNLYDFAPAFNSDDASIDLKTAGQRVITPLGTTTALGTDVLNALAFYVSRWDMNIAASALGAPVALTDDALELPIVSLRIEMEDPAALVYLQDT